MPPQRGFTRAHGACRQVLVAPAGAKATYGQSKGLSPRAGALRPVYWLPGPSRFLPEFHTAYKAPPPGHAVIARLLKSDTAAASEIPHRHRHRHQRRHRLGGAAAEHIALGMLRSVQNGLPHCARRRTTQNRSAFPRRRRSWSPQRRSRGRSVCRCGAINSFLSGASLAHDGRRGDAARNALGRFEQRRGKWSVKGSAWLGSTAPCWRCPGRQVAWS